MKFRTPKSYPSLCRNTNYPMYSRTLAAPNEIDSRDETSIKYERTRAPLSSSVFSLRSMELGNSMNSRDNRFPLVRPVLIGLTGVPFFSQTTVALYSFPDYCPEEDDDGNWTCVAGLMSKNDLKEIWDQDALCIQESTSLHHHDYQRYTNNFYL